MDDFTLKVNSGRADENRIVSPIDVENKIKRYLLITAVMMFAFTLFRIAITLYFKEVTPSLKDDIFSLYLDTAVSYIFTIPGDIFSIVSFVIGKILPTPSIGTSIKVYIVFCIISFVLGIIACVPYLLVSIYRKKRPWLSIVGLIMYAIDTTYLAAKCLLGSIRLMQFATNKIFGSNEWTGWFEGVGLLVIIISLIFHIRILILMSEYVVASIAHKKEKNS